MASRVVGSWAGQIASEAAAQRGKQIGPGEPGTVSGQQQRFHRLQRFVVFALGKNEGIRLKTGGDEGSLGRRQIQRGHTVVADDHHMPPLHGLGGQAAGLRQQSLPQQHIIGRVNGNGQLFHSLSISSFRSRPSRSRRLSVSASPAASASR